MAPEGVNQPLGSPTVAQGLAQDVDAVVKGRVADEVLWPDMCEHLLFRHHTVAVFHEVQQHLKYFRAELQQMPGPSEGVELRIQFTIGEGIPHGLLVWRAVEMIGTV